MADELFPNAAQCRRKNKPVSTTNSVHWVWLGREESNLRMAESKPAWLFNEFKAHLEKFVEMHLYNINRLPVLSKWRRSWEAGP